MKKSKNYKLDKKFKQCILPYHYFDQKKDMTLWLSYDKENKEYNTSQFLDYAFEDFVKTNLTYHYQANQYIKGNYRIKVSHCHSFDEVIHVLYKYPDTFVIPKEYLNEYSEQELQYLKHMQNYFHIINLKDEKRSKELMDIRMKVDELYHQKRTLKNRWDLKKNWKMECKILNKDRIERCNNSKAFLFKNYHFMYEKNEQVIASILKEERDYRIYRKHSNHHSRVGERHFLMDKNDNYRAILEFVSEEEIRFKDLTENMVDYKSSGFKHFKDFKEDLRKNLLEESKWYKEDFNDNSIISYVKFKVVEIIEKNRIR